MNPFQIYLRNEKVKWLNKMREDLKLDTGIDLPHGSGFTRSELCHFVVVGNEKFVHKGAMKFVLTNGDTYFEHQQLPTEVVFNQDVEQRKAIDLKVNRMFDFFREEINNHKLYPTLLRETENFFVFKFYKEEEWIFLRRLTREDSVYINRVYREANQGKKEVVTPFYNQVMYKLMRNNQTREIKMVDLKILEFRPQCPLSILMHDDRSSELYLLERRFWTKSYILKPYSIDYSVRNTQLVKHY